MINWWGFKKNRDELSALRAKHSFSVGAAAARRRKKVTAPGGNPATSVYENVLF